MTLDMKATGARLQQKCKDAGYTAKELSTILNTDTTTPYYWFNGKVMPSWNTMLNLAALLGSTIDDLLVVQEDCDNE